MQTNYLSFCLFFTILGFSFQENTIETKNKNADIKTFNDIKGLSRKEEHLINEIDSLLNNMTETYENRLSNLSERINKLIDFREMINRKQEDKQIINGMINDIKLLKKEYKRNMNFTYMLFGVFLCIIIFFSFSGRISKNNFKRIPYGYRGAIEGQNITNQISIE